MVVDFWVDLVIVNFCLTVKELLQELSYRKQIARQLRTLKSRLRVT